MSSLNRVSKPIRSTQREISVAPPEVSQGGEIWRVAKRAAELDLNSSYMYLLFARDFAKTSRIAVAEGEAVAFVLGYRRPQDPACLFIWQIAVDERFRGRRLAQRMLDDLISASRDEEIPIRKVETTITDDNTASRRLFSSLAERWGAALTTRPLFEASDFPDGHDSEQLHEIGPIDPNALAY